MKYSNALLLTSVFITGLCVLVLEICATRIIAPYYGNTIYTTSSVIGTTLAALAMGYWLGGLLCDKHPNPHLFYGIIFTGGFLTSRIYQGILYVLPVLPTVLSIQMGPLVASLILFFVPIFILGMLSPFAIKLYAREQGSIGAKSGQVFFWSTTGSIAGSLLAGFVFIPYVGLNSIIIATAITLCILGFLGFILQNPFKLKPFLALLALFLYTLISFWILPPEPNPLILYDRDGVYEKITIYDGQWQGRPARFLMQDTSSSAAMYLDDSDLVYNYTKYYALTYLFKPKPSRVLIIGGGAYSMPKAFLQDNPTTNVDVAEIEPQLKDLAKTYFSLQDSPRLVNYIQDGRQLLNQNTATYDAIVSDVYYSYFSIPPQFCTQEFFELAKQRLTENGVFIGNFAGTLNPSAPSLTFSEIKTFKSVFPNSYFFAVQSPDTKTSQNIIFLGINGKQTIDFTILKNSKNPIIANLGQKNIDISSYDFSDHATLTDNYSPIEYLVGRAVKNY